MTRPLAVTAAALVLVTGAAPAAAAPAKSLTKARAEAAIVKKVEASYRKQVGGRDVAASCRRVTSRRYTCDYGVYLGDQDETDDQDRNPYKYEGKGSVTKARSGKVTTRVSRPV